MKPSKGFGHYEFKDLPGKVESGNGVFADIQIGRKKSLGWASAELRRIPEADLHHITRVMKNGTDDERAYKIRSMLAEFIGSGVQAEAR